MPALLNGSFKMSVNLNTLVLLVGIFLRCSVSLYGYSGESKGPMYGDYEAQRHWMEITFNLDVKEWYFNTSDNDLLYWGLDYPPLTAYHSWICGAIAHYLNPQFVELNKSRGYESPEHKIFMRNTVLVADLITYIGGAILIIMLGKSGTIEFLKENTEIVFLLLLFYPGLILIDHGHFQYNCVSLGFSLYSMIALFNDFDILAAILFCAAISYKQMLLYYALPIFFYYLGLINELFHEKGFYVSLKKFISLASSVIVSFSIIWLPFISSWSILAQVLHRLFPFNRGIFEDKVSNFWCVLNVVFKFRQHLTNESVAFICAFLTFSFLLPSCLNVLRHPSKERYLLATLNSSLAFFLFSYQVHEKTILLVTLPVILSFNYQPFHSIWFLNISTLSMLPLILKDNLIIPFIALSVIFNVSLYAISCTKNMSFFDDKKSTRIFIISISFGVILALCSSIVNPPSKYPDLFPLLISVYSALHFMYFLLFFTYKQFKLPKNKVKWN